jgi:hypothetical protein
MVNGNKWGSFEIFGYLQESKLYDTLGLTPVVAERTYFGMPHTEDGSPVFCILKFEPSEDKVCFYRGDEEVSWSVSFDGFKEYIKLETLTSRMELERAGLAIDSKMDMVAYRLTCKRISENTDNALTYLKNRVPITRVTLVESFHPKGEEAVLDLLNMPLTWLQKMHKS